MKRRITENLDVVIEGLQWCCHHCGHSLGSARENYKKGCLIAERSPHEIWRPLVDEKHSFSYDPGWARIVEFYCPGCAVMMDVEMLPPGHPITHDIELDVDALVRRARQDKTGSDNFSSSDSSASAEKLSDPVLRRARQEPSS